MCISFSICKAVVMLGQEQSVRSIVCKKLNTALLLEEEPAEDNINVSASQIDISLQHNQLRLSVSNPDHEKVSLLRQSF